MSKPQTNAAKAAPDAAAQTQQPDAAHEALTAQIAQLQDQLAELTDDNTRRLVVERHLKEENAHLLNQLDRARAEFAVSECTAKAHAQASHGTHIRVASLADGYFRAGQQFSRQSRELAVAELTAEQLQAIRADSRLVVVDL